MLDQKKKKMTIRESKKREKRKAKNLIVSIQNKIGLCFFISLFLSQ